MPRPQRNHSTVSFEKIKNPAIKWIIKRYIQEKIQTTSSNEGYTSFWTINSEVFSKFKEFEITLEMEYSQIKFNLIKLMECCISNAREGQRLWAMYRPIQWYIWCADNYPEIGFCTAYAMELDAISVPGNPKGEAVRLEDPDKGGLHRSLELPLLIKAMRADASKQFSHIQEKAALALSLALGRNPANLTFLKESDLVNLTPDSTSATWIIKMPRIKKRQLNPRDDLLDEYLDLEFASYLIALIETNKSISIVGGIKNSVYEMERPLFINIGGNKAATLSGLSDSQFNITSEKVNKLLNNFVKRHSIVSPITNQLLRINSRRIRYTVGNSLAAEGISRKELARILDHSDTQHVAVYFESAGRIVEHLDKAAAKGYAEMLNLFTGKVVNSPDEAVNGNRGDKQIFFVSDDFPKDHTDIGVCGKAQLCHLDPPYSCYLCEKFQPYLHADHDHVLDCLLNSRNERLIKYKDSKLGIQLDDVIFAVADVVNQCRRNLKNE